MYDRRKTIGASDAVHIKAGNWTDLYDRKHATGANEWPLAASIGKALEPFHRELFTRETGIPILYDENWTDAPLRLTALDKTLNPPGHARFPWCTYLPDGLIANTDICLATAIPWEGKAINMMWKPHNLLNKYMPQLQHAMRVMRADHCIFSVIYLNTRWEYQRVEYDQPYDDALFELEKAFYWHLANEDRP